jgi:SAM-dependent methyltransferase
LASETPIVILKKHLENAGHSEEYISFQIRSLFDSLAFEGRVSDFLGMADPPLRESLILVSGASVGEELQALHNVGYRNLTGTEISDIYIDICNIRFDSRITVKKVTGELMPFHSQSVGAVFSAHIVEHTRSPKTYIHECLRCLTPGGLLYLEFPSRYNKVELHTGTVSFEWLPLPMRYIALRLLSFFAVTKGNRTLYRSVLETLRPVGVGMMLRFARNGGYKVRIEGRQTIGGIERLVLRVLDRKS